MTTPERRRLDGGRAEMRPAVVGAAGAGTLVSFIVAAATIGVAIDSARLATAAAFVVDGRRSVALFTPIAFAVACVGGRPALVAPAAAEP